MSFFERQAAARRTSRRLLWLLLPALAGMLVAANGAALLLWWAGRVVIFPLLDLLPFWPPLWFYPAVTLATAWYVAMGTWDSMNLVAQGGAAIARYLGARPVDPRSGDVDELRLRNVAEEMAIASGLPAPAAYVMDGEEGVNAFTSGATAGDAVLVVTGGALRGLKRDELQGVVAHEFGHILNGDLALNMRLFGLLGGILRLWLRGEELRERLDRWTQEMKTRGARPKGFLLEGLASGLLRGVGSFGHWAAGLVSGAVSRQRELLADACAVQYTRNPDGIAGALMKLGSDGRGGRIHHPFAEHVAFMFFGDGLPFDRVTSFATHPALKDRLAAIYGRPVSVPALAAKLAPKAVPPAERVGTVAPEQIAYASAFLAGLPAGLREALRSAEGAVDAMHALVLAPEGAGREGQLAALGARAQAVAALQAAIAPLGARARLPLVELAAPALRNLDAAARTAFFARFDALVAADRRVTLEEFVLEAILRGLLEPPRGGTRPLSSVAAEARTLLSLAAHAGGADAAAAFERGREALGEAMRLVPRAQLGLAGIRDAFARLRELHPMQKPRLLKAVASAALADGKVEPAEAELVRAISAALDCPMPPLLPEG